MGTNIDDKRILVTGGTGFIGKHLCSLLLGGGYDVYVLTRDKVRATQRLPAKVNLCSSLGELDSSMYFFGVINLAGAPLAEGRWSEKRKRQIYNSRIGTTNALYKHFVQVQQPPKVLINGSAIGYYGPHKDEPLDEESEAVNSFSHQLCHAWEYSAKSFASIGCRVCCVRIGVVLGAEEGALNKMLTPFKLGFGGRLGSGRQWFSWIHLKDMVSMLRYCLEHPDIRGPVNATAPGTVTNAEFTQTLAGVLRRPALLPLPAVVARLLFGELAQELLLTGQRVVPEKILRAGYQFQFENLSAALRDILER